MVSAGRHFPATLIESDPNDTSEEVLSVKFHPRVLADPELAEWRQHVIFFKSVQKKLVKDPSLVGRYVAIKDKTIIDSDLCKFTLARRVSQESPGATILITKVESSSPVVEIASPEIV